MKELESVIKARINEEMSTQGNNLIENETKEDSIECNERDGNSNEHCIENEGLSKGSSKIEASKIMEVIES